MTTVVITNYHRDLECLPRCFNSFKEADEIIIISSKLSSLSQKINKGFKMGGDYIIITNDDVELLTGDINDLCIPNTVTSPLVNGEGQPFFGHIFCVPKNIYEKTGGYDENYKHAWFDDTDFVMTLSKHGIPMQSVPSVNVFHPHGGGTTIKTLPDLDDVKRFNQEYFEKKWGPSAD